MLSKHSTNQATFPAFYRLQNRPNYDLVPAKVCCPGCPYGAGVGVILSLPPAVPELAARGIIQQVFPVHEQRILNRLMKSWVQAVCENQPLGVDSWLRSGLGSQEILGGDPASFVPWQMTFVTTLG